MLAFTLPIINDFVVILIQNNYMNNIDNYTNIIKENIAIKYDSMKITFYWRHEEELVYFQEGL